ncbi:MAG TPA: Hsp20/alpha crystallin family protein [Polyangiaceae bacterium]|jgi:HSP20 family protein|nr:MAG: Spore protein SP21 [Deltaproteobacteria bacterium ADurb.Bin207]HNS98941.1 Hsp20/alpha crystallin family protein [Polyangiaceae bacterium]HNZ23023.1 Hsp20/alpha crystallin family protein [Polyangiaceae bacterium]HOD21200.1 Hsp20/alpha crystallin family protein [Polyangiaceae bacterium]HOE49036.1 Hsp20/alpha crystallin family protein [Polyangiaceae bacterium]
MTDKQELQLREKKELKQEGEATREGPHFRPEVDIFEREDALVMVADVPGSSNEQIELDLQDNSLNLTATVSGVDAKWKPVYLEYEIGHYIRQFRIGQIVDMAKISAQVKDGVLVVTLPKIEKAMPRKIEVKSEQ